MAKYTSFFGQRVVIDTIMIEHKMGDMLDYDLIEENL